MSHDTEGFKSLSMEEQLKTISAYLDIFLAGADENEMKALLTNITQKIMGNGMSMMKDMQKIVGSGMSAMNDVLKTGGTLDMGDLFQSGGTLDMNGVFSILGGNLFKQTGSRGATPEIKALFEEWVRQVQEEIENFKKENKDAARKDIAQYLKISEQSLKYFIKDGPGEETPKPE